METLKQMLTRHEGRKLKPYRCSASKWTVGVGYNFDDNPLPQDIKDYLTVHGMITDEMSDRLLDLSIGWAVADCNKMFPLFNEFSPARQNALIDFLFNLGSIRAKRFVHAIAAINTGRWDDAAAAMRDSTWFRQVGNRAKEVCAMIEAG